VTAETPNSLMHSAPPDRRPAIWPWLVMPLITLLVFYWLDSRDQVSGQVGGWKARGPASDAATATE
jgi:hypothetical protein